MSKYTFDDIWSAEKPIPSPFKNKTMLEGKEWISSETPPKANTQCKAKTPNGIDENGEAWYDGVKWWYWPKDSNAKFGIKEGFITHYIPLCERLSELVNNKYK